MRFCFSKELSLLVLLASWLITSLCHAQPVAIIDAGHGEGPRVDESSPNNASYKSARYGAVLERELTFEIANEVAAYLNHDGRVRAVLSRPTESNVGMGDRAAVAIAHRASVLVSIHFNASPQHTASGPRAILQSTKKAHGSNTAAQHAMDTAFGRLLIGHIYQVTGKLGTGKPLVHDYDAKPEGSHLFRNLRDDAFGKGIEACFLEVDFMDNPKVAGWLIEADNSVVTRRRIAHAIAEGIIAWHVRG